MEGNFKERSDFHVLGWFPGLQNLNVFEENLLCSKFQYHFLAEIIP